MTAIGIGILCRFPRTGSRTDEPVDEVVRNSEEDSGRRRVAGG